MCHALGQPARYLIGPLEIVPEDTLVEVAADWECIHTHHAIGYRLEPEPREDGS